MPTRREDDREQAGRPTGSRVVSMRLILGAAAIALTAVAVLGVGYVAERHGRETLSQEMEGRLLLEARNLALVAADALLTEFPELTLVPVVSEMQQGRRDLAYVAVLDRQGLVQGHLDARRLDTPFTELAALTPVTARLPLAAQERLMGDAEHLAAVVPVALNDGRSLGTAVVGLRRAYLEQQVTRERRTLLALTGVLAALASGLAFGLTTLLLRPLSALRDGLARIGRGDLDTPLRVPGRTELSLLADAVNGMARQLKASQAQRIEKERLAHEMELARSVQESLMPKADTVAGEYTVAGLYQAAAEVGGDYWDVFRRRDGRLGVAIADVAGKGLGGCLVTSMLAVLLRSLREEHDSPAALLAAVEERLLDSLRPGVFVTLFYGLLDPDSGRFTFASAAHSPLLVWRAGPGELEWHRTRGIPLGAVRGRRGALAASLDDVVLDLGPGDLLVQYTDGLNEARDAALRQEFGLERIGQIVRKAAPRGAAAVRQELQSELRAWTGERAPDDDLTLLVVGRQPAAAGAEADWRRLLGEFQGGPALTLPATLSALDRLRPWLAALPGLAGAGAEACGLVESSLYELCANVIEHGQPRGEQAAIEIRWRPAARGGAAPPIVAAASAADAAAGGGWFLVQDRGKVYDLAGWRPSDLADPAVRRRGRGLGLQIVHAAMRQVRYLPGTPAGNLTLLRFAPAGDGAEHGEGTDREERRHV